MSKINKKDRKQLLFIAQKAKQSIDLSPFEVEKLLRFELVEHQSKTLRIITAIAVPFALILGFSEAAFPDFFSKIVDKLPVWTNFTDHTLAGIDYLWNIFTSKVQKNNFIYHIPNIALHAFGILGAKKVIEYIRNKTWLDKVLNAKTMVKEKVINGEFSFAMRKGHSILFVGSGDFIGHQYAMNSPKDETITISNCKPFYTDTWNKYDISSPFSCLKSILEIANAESSGEIIFFPVTDLHLFLPGKEDFDISPEKLEVLINAVRDIEKMNGWKPNKVIIVGDKKQESKIQTETKVSALEETLESVSLETIKERFEHVYILDPSDLVAQELLKRFPDHKFLFRSSLKGSQVYKKRFFDRLEDFGYVSGAITEKIVTIGYDLLEEQIELEARRKALVEYMPIVLSKEVHDAIIRQQLPKDKFIYVPDLVINKLKELSS